MPVDNDVAKKKHGEGCERNESVTVEGMSLSLFGSYGSKRGWPSAERETTLRNVEFVIASVWPKPWVMFAALRLFKGNGIYCGFVVIHPLHNT